MKRPAPTFFKGSSVYKINLISVMVYELNDYPNNNVYNKPYPKNDLVDNPQCKGERHDERNDLNQTLLDQGRQVGESSVVWSNLLRRPNHLTMSPGASLTLDKYTPISAAVLLV